MDELRRSAGLPGDPGGEALRRSPYLTHLPASLEDPAGAEQPRTVRLRDPAWDAPPSELPGWRPDDDTPLLYVTFGSVAGGMEMAAPVYAVAMEAVAELPVRALLTTGHDADPDALGPAPANVRVERWVPQRDVFAHAAAVVCHGGSGSTLGAIAAGLPLVVVPLFADQPYNARRVAAIGAGLVASPDPAAIRDAVGRVLKEESYRTAAEGLAAELRAQPSIDASVDVLAGLMRATGAR